MCVKFLDHQLPVKIRSDILSMESAPNAKLTATIN